MAVIPRGPDHEGTSFMADESVARIPRTRTARYYRCDYPFLELLEEIFGIGQFSLRSAFMGVPPANKKRATALCRWASRTADGDTKAAGDLLRAWAKKNGVGTYDRRLRTKEGRA